MKKRILSTFLALVTVASLSACTQPAGPTEQDATTSVPSDILSELGLTAEAKQATDHTIEVNSAVYSLLDFENTQEWEFATANLIDAPDTLELTDKNGNVIWSQAAFSFLEDYEKAPNTVNPSLWENTKNNHAYGLFKVVDGIYQVRGYDMSNLTVVEGDSGWILFDPLMSVECTQAAIELVNKNLGERPIKAVIISHPHADHFGGILGAMSKDDAADASLSIKEQLDSGYIPIIVPEGFAEHAIAENVYAGKAMSRRANYQYGTLLNPGVTGTLAMGIGMGQSKGTVSFIMPTYEVTDTGETITIDGVDFVFQLTPGTEAPAEMNTWLPKFKALWMAENCTGTLHNLYTLRGAQVRDGAAWAKYILDALSLYGDEAEVVFQSHNWPHWGNDVLKAYMVDTAAIYQFINDQTLTYINQGYTANEICNMIELPAALEKNWHTRQYYGTLSHNARAVYQKYMGWYDANPVNLNPMTPTESAKKWVEYMGDTNEVLRKAKEDFDKGEYRWVAEVTNTIVFADPENTAARLLCADALEQLGYQAESGPWRNAYLTAALELRNGNSVDTTANTLTDGSLQREMTASMIIDYMGILLDKQAMAEKDFTINVYLPDVDEAHGLQVKNGILLHYEHAPRPEADVTIRCPKNALLYILSNNAEGVSQAIQVEGDAALLTAFMEAMNQFKVSVPPSFNIVEP